jgi:multidrug efflux pump subunit AcrA (membrane-fusion protein)
MRLLRNKFRCQKVRFAMTVGVVIILISGCSPRKDFYRTVFSGTIEMTEHVLGIKGPGRLTILNVKEGDIVKKGQVLARFDRLQQAQKDYERMVVMYKNGGVNQQAVENARLTMEDQQVVSPLDGIVLVKSAEIGEIIPAGGAVVVVGNPLEKWVKIFVAEDLMHYLRLNQPATIFIDGTRKTYKGRVSFIADKAEFTPRNVQTPDERITQTFAVKVAIDDADENLHAGVAADVKFE